MADRGIIFSSSMVLALGDGRKTQTRRIIKGLGDDIDNVGDGESVVDLASGKVIRMPYAEGDRLYVRESCRAEEIESGQDCIRFLADERLQPIENSAEAADKWLELFHYGKGPADRVAGMGKSVPSIHMPRWASRLWLAVESVHLERVRDITEAEAIAEGVMNTRLADGRCLWNPDLVGGDPINSARHAFAELWNSLHGTKPGERWDDNPWIVATSFAVHKGNIDSAGNL